ncbi:MAG TPA: hypothetical protein VMF31_01425 [Solirubrobacterales bacterium]|nr:hypothetical protein [Solirubrobacterales bacterium]
MGDPPEAELQGTESAENGPGAGVSQEQIESLRVSTAAIAREIQMLGDKVTALIASVENLGPAPAPNVVRKKTGEAEAAPAEADDGKIVTVKVSPLPELAMAAVAETTLRNLPGVRQVSGVKREGDWAEFTLEVVPGTDLIAEMRTSMPVSFKVDDASADAISLSLQWAWGAS